MRRILFIGITILLLSALVPGVGEILENAVHLATEGHFAHAAADGDHHESPGPEHGCNGTMHLCSCCVSPSFAPTQGLPQIPSLGSHGFVPVAATYPTMNSSGSVYHPPRA